MLLEGSNVSQLLVNSSDGNSKSLSFRGRLPSVIYFFSPTCTWCERNLANIQSLARQNRNKYAFYGVSLTDTGLRDYIENKPMGFEVYSLARDTPASLLPPGTPTTIVINSDGIIVKKWDGAFIGHGRQEVERFFGCSLPN